MIYVHIHPDAGPYIKHNDRIYVALENLVGACGVLSGCLGITGATAFSLAAIVPGKS